MANGKEANGLVPRVAWESWAPLQLTLGPGWSNQVLPDHGPAVA